MNPSEIGIVDTMLSMPLSVPVNRCTTQGCEHKLGPFHSGRTTTSHWDGVNGMDHRVEEWRSWSRSEQPRSGIHLRIRTGPKPIHLHTGTFPQVEG